MSPSAIIATVLVALLCVAWLFQSDAKDPAYEAYLRRQQELQKEKEAGQKAGLGGGTVNITDSGVTHEPGSLTNRRPAPIDAGHSDGAGEPPLASGIVINGIPDFPIPEWMVDAARPPATTRPAELTNRFGFGTGTKLNGTFVGVAFLNDLPSGPDAADAPSITFRPEGVFVTQNMAAADVDMEAGGLIPTERGSGRYKLYANTLELTYTDGMARKKGNKRSYTVVPVGGDDEAAPTAMTIQGKVFKLDPNR